MASGFNNIEGPNSSEFRKSTSWGRTRQPKNIAGGHGTAVTAVGEASVAADLTLLNGGDTDDRKARGYTTENQRYLHVTCEAAGAVTNVYVYSHAFDKWSELVQTNGDSYAVGNSEHKIFTIAGIDKVAFRLSGNVYAAGSTF
jgi:hypothetical protein